MASKAKPGHALHSPNITKAELQAYLAAPAPVRHRHSLVEVSEHDPHLVNYLLSPPDPRLVQELIKTTERVIRIPSDSLAPGAPITPPVTPIRSASRQQQQQKVPIPVHLSPKWRPLEQFVVRLIQTSGVRVATLAYALIILDRLKEKLPSLAQGMHCTRHRIFLAALVVGSKYLNDSTPKNKHWANYTRGLFDTYEITLMEKQMLGLLDFDLRITEEELVTRLSPFIHPKPPQKSRGRKGAGKAQEGAGARRPPQPLTPITPSNNRPPSSVPAIKVDGVSVERSSEPDQAFVLQPVPAIKKRGEKASGCIKMENRSVSLSSSQSVPLHMDTKQDEKPSSTANEAAPCRPILALPNIPFLEDSMKQPNGRAVSTFKASVAMPLVRSLSSDGLLEGASSMAMHAARTFSSNASSSMTSSSSVSTSTSTSRSEVATPVDRPSVWVADSASQHYFQAHPTRIGPAKSYRLRRRGSESATIPVPTFMMRGQTDSNSKDSGAMNKLIGVGKMLSPKRRIGHGVKGDRKVSTATIIPNEVSPRH